MQCNQHLQFNKAIWSSILITNRIALWTAIVWCISLYRIVHTDILTYFLLTLRGVIYVLHATGFWFLIFDVPSSFQVRRTSWPVDSIRVDLQTIWWHEKSWKFNSILKSSNRHEHFIYSTSPLIDWILIGNIF